MSRLAIVAAIVVCLAGCAKAARCMGDENCTACKTCSSCKHCAKNGGTCGVCSARSLTYTDRGDSENPEATHWSHNIGGLVVLCAIGLFGAYRVWVWHGRRNSSRLL